jgi:SprT-like family
MTKKVKRTKQKQYSTKQKQREAVTRVEYSGFQTAFDHFNKQLFDDQLPNTLIVLTRRAHSRGHYAHDRFSGRTRRTNVGELSLNPDTFIDRTDEQILSTLVHEMVHVWQQAFGNPSWNGYHNKQWAQRMKEVGLHPSNTGAVGGKETGQSMSHIIVPDGPCEILRRASQDQFQIELAVGHCRRRRQEA